MKIKDIFLIYLVIVIILKIIFVIFFYDSLRRHFLSRKLYKKSKLQAEKKNKKLMVIGDPCVGNVNKILQKIYPNCFHGDVTIDLYGCEKCDKFDINNIDYWKKYKTNEFVIFETATLPFSKNIEIVLKEIKRISGGDFYSAGGNTSFLWKNLGHKLYSKQYKKSLISANYPFDSSEDRYIKIYLFKNKEYKNIKF